MFRCVFCEESFCLLWDWIPLFAGGKSRGLASFLKLRSGHLELPNHVRTYAYIWVTVPSSRKALHNILVFLHLGVKVNFTPVCRANSNITYFESWNYNKSNNYMYLCHVSYQILPALLSKAYSYALAWENTNLFLFGSQIGHWRGVTNRKENIRLLKLHISSSLLPVTLRFAGISHPCGRSVTVFADYIAKNRIMLVCLWLPMVFNVMDNILHLAFMWLYMVRVIEQLTLWHTHINISKSYLNEPTLEWRESDFYMLDVCFPTCTLFTNLLI